MSQYHVTWASPTYWDMQDLKEKQAMKQDETMSEDQIHALFDQQYRKLQKKSLKKNLKYFYSFS